MRSSALNGMQTRESSRQHTERQLCNGTQVMTSADVDQAIAPGLTILLLQADKNQHRLEEADVRFKELQNAYEVLSDKHERAW